MITHWSIKPSSHPLTYTRVHVSVIHPLINPLIRLSLYPSRHACVHSHVYVCSYIHVSIHLFIRSSELSSTLASIHIYVHPSLHSTIHASIQISMNLFIQTPFHPSIQPSALCKALKERRPLFIPLRSSLWPTTEQIFQQGVKTPMIESKETEARIEGKMSMTTASNIPLWCARVTAYTEQWLSELDIITLILMTMNLKEFET